MMTTPAEDVLYKNIDWHQFQAMLFKLQWLLDGGYYSNAMV